MALAGNGDVVLLHGLQQGRLGLWRGAVDLVRHQQLGEDRALDEAERAAPAGSILKNLGADDVGRHEVGRKLDALGFEAQHAAQRFDEQRFCKARNTDQQRMAACQYRDQRTLNDDVLAENHGRGFLMSALDALGGSLEAGNDRFFCLDYCAHVLTITRLSKVGVALYARICGISHCGSGVGLWPGNGVLGQVNTT